MTFDLHAGIYFSSVNKIGDLIVDGNFVRKAAATMRKCGDFNNKILFYSCVLCFVVKKDIFMYFVVEH